jgi:hypothetical protein
MIPAQMTATAIAQATTVTPAGRTPALLELAALDSLPCGCVAAAFRAKPWDLAVVSIEAKGPHCPNGLHVQGRVLELGVVSDLLAEEGEE